MAKQHTTKKVDLSSDLTLKNKLYKPFLLATIRDILIETVGKKRNKDAKISVDDFADKAGMSNAQIWRIIKEPIKDMKLSTLSKLINAAISCGYSTRLIKLVQILNLIKELDESDLNTIAHLILRLSNKPESE